ncbi:hypothetical protein [Actinomadura hibisca]|uniref:hypothetical protein n=1 Tax=Actinomadura hibisca TaxID=68565 RepID=UPI0008347B68|nr:hypothetical protein [Actinomadura hibisca]
MDLTPYVDHLRRELAATAAIGGPQVGEPAARLIDALEPVARMALLEALSDATDEITRELAPGAVEVRLRGGRLGFVVTSPPRDMTPHDATVAPEASEADEGGTARVSLRLAEHLKHRAEEAAARDGLSVNAWLVRAVRTALDTPPAVPPRTGQIQTGWMR